MANLNQRQLDRNIIFLTQDEMRRLFHVIKSKRDRALFAVAYRHGLRASEVGMLERAHLDFQQGRITINRLKGSLSGIYPMGRQQKRHLLTFLVEACQGALSGSSPPSLVQSYVPD